MSKLEEALAELGSLLDSLSVPYMLIGGLAVSMWGVARATLDVDLSVWVESSDLEHRVAQLCARLDPLPANPLEFVARTRTLPVNTSQGVRADIIFAVLPFEREAIARAQPKETGGRKVPVVSIEDLVLMKLISEREKDQEDAHQLLARFSNSIDRGYLEPLLTDLSEVLARPDILTAYRNARGG
jgi:predicted nucleotidyltransferase